MTRQNKTYYFLGIGGIGMSAIARYLNMQGHRVMGYDRTKSELTANLEQEGISISYQDREENLPENVDLLIYTPAISKDNKQLQKALSEKIPIKKRSVVLGEITKDKRVLAVAGTHGKTTTCGLIAHLLSVSPIGCSAFLGGILKSVNNNFIYNAKSPYVVVEADEYDRSFLCLSPYVSVVTSIDPDHLDIYKNYSNLHKAFEQFALLTHNDGLLVVKTQRQELVETIKDKRPTQTYSLQDDKADAHASNIRIENGCYLFDFTDQGEVFSDLKMTYPGRHNIENAVCAMKVVNFVLKQEGMDFAQRERVLREGLETFSGIKRRLDYILKTEDKIYIDDYAHHPQEIATTILSVKELYPDKHLCVVFQPHLYTRTRDLADEFAKSLSLPDSVVLLPIYPAREEPIPGVTSKTIFDKIDNPNKYLVSKQELQDLLRKLDPECLLSMGAGDIDRLIPEIKKTITL